MCGTVFGADEAASAKADQSEELNSGTVRSLLPFKDESVWVLITQKEWNGRFT